MATVFSVLIVGSPLFCLVGIILWDIFDGRKESPWAVITCLLAFAVFLGVIAALVAAPSDWLSKILNNATYVDIIKYTLGPSVILLTFVLTQILQMILASRTHHREIKRIVIGIYTEIAHNLGYADRFLRNPGVFDAIKQRLAADDANAVAEIGRAHV